MVWLPFNDSALTIPPAVGTSAMALANFTLAVEPG